MTLQRQLCGGVILLGILLLAEKYTDIDLLIQDFFYSPENGWIIDRELHRRLSPIFYGGFKNLIIFSGIIALSVWALSFRMPRLSQHRRPALLLALSIIFVPLIVAGGKQITNVYCPAQLERYGGSQPFVRVIDAYPDGYVQAKRGKCFPAGHATTGFALMMLWFCFESKKARKAALAAALAAGWAVGTYQMLRGQHFLSHTLFTMIASWLVIIIIVEIVNRITKHEPSESKP